MIKIYSGSEYLQIPMEWDRKTKKLTQNIYKNIVYKKGDNLNQLTTIIQSNDVKCD